MKLSKSPYTVIKERYVTEKAQMLQSLHTSQSNKSLAKCDKPKYVFIVDSNANKAEIKNAIEEIYAQKKVSVKAVNTVTIPAKKRRMRGRIGYKSAFKKAIITLKPGDSLD